jgi:hypothetical protein
MADGGAERRNDAERRATIDTALTLADAEAAFGDYEQAWRRLDEAEELSGGALARRCVAIRQGWYDREFGLMQ